MMTVVGWVVLILSSRFIASIGAKTREPRCAVVCRPKGTEPRVFVAAPWFASTPAAGRRRSALPATVGGVPGTFRIGDRCTIRH
jgi:hypothetical protein